MRIGLVLVVLAAVATATDAVEAALRRLEDVRSGAIAPGARARVFPVVEKLAESGDVRAVRPLALFLVEVLQAERDVEKLITSTTKRGSAAYDRMQAIDKELVHLRMREQAGAKVGPEIEKRDRARRGHEDIFRGVQQDVERLGRSVEFAQELREKITIGLSALIRKLSEKQSAAGIAALRQSLDATEQLQSLYLVRILRSSGRPEITTHLVEILTHTKVHESTRRAAALALASRPDKRGVEALLSLWEREPKKAGSYVRYSLSIAARRELADLEQARAWAATLK